MSHYPLAIIFNNLVLFLIVIIASIFVLLYMDLWRRQWQPTPVLLPGKSHGWRSLVGCSPWGREESDTTERLHSHLSLSCIGEGNGNPLQCSCPENPRDCRAWWAAIYGVAQSWTRLKRLSNDMKIKILFMQKTGKTEKLVKFGEFIKDISTLT